MTTPEHDMGRPSGTGAATGTDKPLILPFEIVQMLRGERSYTEDSKDTAELAMMIYQDGKAGKPYASAPAPGYAPQFVEMMDRFLSACWEQGRKDAGEVRA